MLQWSAVVEDLTRIMFHRGDAIAKLLKIRRLRQNRLAQLSGHGPNTITKLINGNVETEPHVLADVLRVLEVDIQQVDALVRRMNGDRIDQAVPANRPPRAHNARREDRDPEWREAALYIQTLLSFPDLPRLMVYNMIRGIESILRSRDKVIP
jgi:hypothetical protein